MRGSNKSRTMMAGGNDIVTEKNVKYTHVMLSVRGDSYFGQSWNDDSDCPSSVEVKQIKPAKPARFDRERPLLLLLLLLLMMYFVSTCIYRIFSVSLIPFRCLRFIPWPNHRFSSMWLLLFQFFFLSLYFIRRFESVCRRLLYVFLLLSFPIYSLLYLC